MTFLPLLVMSSNHPLLSCRASNPFLSCRAPTPYCHVERSRDISAALAACAQRRIYEISPRATLGRDDRVEEVLLVL